MVEALAAARLCATFWYWRRLGLEDMDERDGMRKSPSTGKSVRGGGPEGTGGRPTRGGGELELVDREGVSVLVWARVRVPATGREPALVVVVGREVELAAALVLVLVVLRLLLRLLLLFPSLAMVLELSLAAELVPRRFRFRVMVVVAVVVSEVALPLVLLAVLEVPREVLPDEVSRGVAAAARVRVRLRSRRVSSGGSGSVAGTREERTPSRPAMSHPAAGGE